MGLMTIVRRAWSRGGELIASSRPAPGRPSAVGRHTPAEVDRQHRASHRLLRFAAYFDSLMLGRRGVERPAGERDLHGTGDASSPCSTA